VLLIEIDPRLLHFVSHHLLPVILLLLLLQNSFEQVVAGPLVELQHFGSHDIVDLLLRDMVQ